MLNKTTILCVVGLLISLNIFADETLLQKPPVIPEPLADGETIEPEVNIIQKEDRIIEEYRLNGQLYMIKVTPTVGKPYYYVDHDGDGSLETRENELSAESVPNWILLKW